MRMPNPGEDLVGKVCCCSIGRPAIVTGTGRLRDLTFAWVGLGLDGKGAWASTAPCVLAETGQEFYDKLLARFDGKM